MRSAVTLSPQARGRLWPALLRQAPRLAVAAALVAAAIGKAATPNESAEVLRESLRVAYGVSAPPLTLLGGAVAVDLLLAVLVGLPRLRPALAALVAFLGVAFLAHHVATGGVACGCFGTHPLVPSWLPWILAAAVAATGVGGLCASTGASLRRRDLAFAAVVAVLPIALAAPIGALLPSFASPSAGQVGSDRIAARDALLFVFSPSCPSCESEAKEILRHAAGRRVVGIATPGLGDLAAFFRRVGTTFPVEFVSRERWFGMIDAAPPAYYTISAEGALTRIGSDSVRRGSW